MRTLLIGYKDSNKANFSSKKQNKLLYVICIYKKEHFNKNYKTNRYQVLDTYF